MLSTQVLTGLMGREYGIYHGLRGEGTARLVSQVGAHARESMREGQ